MKKKTIGYRSRRRVVLRNNIRICKDCILLEIKVVSSYFKL